MGQVPHYLLIGNGRVSRHIQHYFFLLKIHYTVWHRQHSIIELQTHLKQCTHILFLISDHAIDEFIQTYCHSTKAICIHFSGSLVSMNAYGAHPLMTFSEKLYDFVLYQSIPFIIDHDALDFSDLFPNLNNPHIRLDTSLKAKYHAYCVLSGNFSCLLWQKLFKGFEKEFGIPVSFAHPYLKQITKNLIEDSDKALTGPLTRGDQNTLEKNVAALKEDAFQTIYESFITCYQRLQTEEV